MSDSQSAVIGAGGSRYITNPKHLSQVLVGESSISIKTAANAVAGATTAGFYTSIANRGASSAITVADTYVTVCNLTGAGFMFSCVSPSHTAGFTPTIRITVDGVAYTIAPTAAASANSRLVVGSITPGSGTTATGTAATAGDVIVVNGARDGGFGSAPIGGIPVSSGVIHIPVPELVLAYGMQCLRFETSLKVEMKADLLSATPEQKQCAVTYRLDL